MPLCFGVIYNAARIPGDKLRQYIYTMLIKMLLT